MGLWLQPQQQSNDLMLSNIKILIHYLNYPFVFQAINDFATK
jgi:hypothetical protein